MSAPYILATALGDDLITGWSGEIEINLGTKRAPRWVAVSVLRGDVSKYMTAKRLDPRRPEVAHRIADVLRSKGHEIGHLLPVSLGGRQEDVIALAEPTCTHPGCDEAAGHGGVHQMGNTRQIVTIPAADVSAVLLAASVAGVEAGRGVVRGPATPWQQPYPSEPERWERSRPDWDGAGPRLLAGVYKDGWWVTVGGHPTAWPSGPETGHEGRAAADAALLRLGYAYLDAAAPVGVVVPFNLGTSELVLDPVLAPR